MLLKVMNETGQSAHGVDVTHAEYLPPADQPGEWMPPIEARWCTSRSAIIAVMRIRFWNGWGLRYMRSSTRGSCWKCRGQKWRAENTVAPKMLCVVGSSRPHIRSGVCVASATTVYRYLRQSSSAERDRQGARRAPKPLFAESRRNYAGSQPVRRGDGRRAEDVGRRRGVRGRRTESPSDVRSDGGGTRCLSLFARLRSGEECCSVRSLGERRPGTIRKGMAGSTPSGNSKRVTLLVSNRRVWMVRAVTLKRESQWRVQPKW